MEIPRPTSQKTATPQEQQVLDKADAYLDSLNQ
jgi:hypothetical protein